MPRFIEGQDRHQVTLLPESLDDFIALFLGAPPNKTGDTGPMVLPYEFADVVQAPLADRDERNLPVRAGGPTQARRAAQRFLRRMTRRRPDGWRASLGEKRPSPEHDVNLRMRSATRFGVALAKNPRSSWGAFWAMAIASAAPPV